MSHTSKIDKNGNEKVQCLACKERGETQFFHRLDVHLTSKHEGMTVKRYNQRWPDAPTISELARSRAIAPPKDATDEATATPKASEDFKFKNGIKLRKRDLTELSARDRTFIPAHDPDWELGADEMEKWELLAAAIYAGDNVLDVGPTGCGKSTSILELAAVLDQPVQRVNMDGDIRVADFVGEKVVDIDEATSQSVVTWRDGILPDAMRNGHWLLVDEVDAAPPQILFVLQAVLERSSSGARRLVLKSNHGEVIEAHPNFRIFATSNTLGRGDDTGLYAGTNVLNEAFLDRFGVVLESTYPNEETEIKIMINKGGVTKDVASRMRQVAVRIREALSKEECHCTFSTRRLIAWAEKSKLLKDPRKAAAVTVLNKLPKDDRKFVGDIIQRFMGGGIAR